MNLVKTSLLNGIAVVVKVLSALLLNKILAVYVGPAGYAIIGQFQNAVSIIASIAGSVVATGVTKATAQHFDDESRQHAVWKTAIRMSLLASVAAAVFLLVLHDFFAQWILHRSDMSIVFVWLAVSLPAMVVNNLLLAITNGKKEVGIYVAANITGSLLSIVVTGALTSYFGVRGTLIAFTINPAVVLFVTAALISRRSWFKVDFLWGGISPAVFRELSGFALMGLTSALAAPISYLLIRDHLVAHLGLTAAGYWQASWKISEIYLMLVTTTLSVYYLPRIAEIRTEVELKTEILKVYRLVLPIVIAGALVIYAFRHLIIKLLFTPDFLPIGDLFSWQLIGDVIKIAAWVLAYIMLGRAMIKTFIVTEVLFSASFVLLSWLLIDRHGVVGVSMAYACNYFFYLIGMVFLVRREVITMRSGNGIAESFSD